MYSSRMSSWSWNKAQAILAQAQEAYGNFVLLLCCDWNLLNLEKQALCCAVEDQSETDHGDHFLLSNFNGDRELWRRRRRARNTVAKQRQLDRSSNP